MSIRTRWPVWLLGTLLAPCFLFVALSFGLYAWGTRFVPDEIPASSYQAPDSIQQQYLAVEAGGATRMRKLNPVEFWFEFFMPRRPFQEPPPPEEILLYRAARVAEFKHGHARRMSDHHLSSVAFAVKVSRQWTRDQAVNTILAESRFSGSAFRQDVIGIEVAARFYFGVPVAELRPQESLALIALLKGPSGYDPICRRERFEERYAQVVEKLGKTGPEWTAAAALSRLRPIECARR